MVGDLCVARIGPPNFGADDLGVTEHVVGGEGRPVVGDHPPGRGALVERAEHGRLQGRGRVGDDSDVGRRQGRRGRES
jgi:hypothetical protein